MEAAGCVFLSSLLVLFPVAGRLATIRCVTYKQSKICGFEGSSVEIPCSFSSNTQVSDMFWSKRLDPKMKPENLNQVTAFSGRMQYARGGGNDCTLRITDLKESDTSYYSFRYFSVNRTCMGSPGVWLHIRVSAVSVLVEEIVKGRRALVAEQEVTEGQRIILTCVPGCAANPDPAYIWYKNRLLLSGSRAIASLLPLDPISNEDAGSYSCAMTGYEDHPSSAVNLGVRYGPRNTTVSVEIPGDGTTKGGVMTLTCSSDANPPAHGYTWYRRSREGEEVLQRGGRKDFIVAAGFQDDDLYLCEAANRITAQNSTAQNLSKYLKPADKSMFSKIFAASAGVGLVVAITVAGAFLVLKMKKRCSSLVPEPPDPNADPYAALDIQSVSPEYETLDKVRGCSAGDEDCTIYENLHVYQPAVP